MPPKFENGELASTINDVQDISEDLEDVTELGARVLVVDAACCGTDLMSIESTEEFLEVIWASLDIVDNPVLMIACTNNPPLAEIHLAKLCREMLSHRTLIIGCSDPFFVHSRTDKTFDYVVGTQKIGKHLCDIISHGKPGLHIFDTVEDLLGE